MPFLAVVMMRIREGFGVIKSERDLSTLISGFKSKLSGLEVSVSLDVQSAVIQGGL